MDRLTVARLFQSLSVVRSEAVSRLYSSVAQVQLTIIAIPVGVVLFLRLMVAEVASVMRFVHYFHWKG